MPCQLRRFAAYPVTKLISHLDGYATDNDIRVEEPISYTVGSFYCPDKCVLEILYTTSVFTGTNAGSNYAKYFENELKAKERF